MVLPTLNGGERLRRCLSALRAQRPGADALVVVDSGSDDGSDRLAEEAGATLLRIERADFRHGGTRNAAARRLPEVDVIVFLVQDAIPQGSDWLITLAKAALVPGVGAVTARQVPPPEAGALTAASVARSPFAATRARQVGPFSAQELEALRPQAWRGRLLLDSVACAVRGALFREVGFRDTDFGEDALLAYDLLWGGWALAHEPRAVVEHGHVYDPQSVRARYEQDARFFREQFGLRVRPHLLARLKGFLAELRADKRWQREQGAGAALNGNLALRWAQVVAQQAGSVGPLGGLPHVRRVPGPQELAA
ncbi:MAG: hypothetical protein DHS20C15_22710 [Planctomycetota bacterium]|nr:MAG: hypothetical protein DHS20C15_22710 [Planctomycetota bacterium]